MTGWEIPAGVVVTVVLAGLGWVWRLATRLAQTEARTHAAEVLASGASAKATILEQELSAHKEHVASEYLSKDAMKEVTDSINRLGDRLDALFMHFIPRPGG